MPNRHTVPPPPFPSKVKKFAIGGSRAASAFRISCANIPPTTAETGENSCAAVVDNILGRCKISVVMQPNIWTYSMRSCGMVVRTCLFTSALVSRLLAIPCKWLACWISCGRFPWCDDWYSQMAVGRTPLITSVTPKQLTLTKDCEDDSRFQLFCLSFRQLRPLVKKSCL